MMVDRNSPDSRTQCPLSAMVHFGPTLSVGAQGQEDMPVVRRQSNYGVLQVICCKVLYEALQDCALM